MEFTETPLKGAYLVRVKRIEDHRGYFGRGWCQNEFRNAGLKPEMVQLNVGYSHKAGTLRGMHFQDAPHAEAKLVRCMRGSIWDVIVDLRPDSPTYCQSFGAELSGVNGVMLYAPEGFAHGYQTLADESEMYYMTSAFFAPTSARGVRYNDPAFSIKWPLAVSSISAADEKWPEHKPGSPNKS